MDKLPPWLSLVVLLLGGGGLAAIVAAVIAISRRRSELKTEGFKLTQDEREGAIKEWKDYAKNVSTSLRAEIQLLNVQLQAHRQELNDQRKVEIEFKVAAAKQEQVILHLNEDIVELRRENEEMKETLVRSGLRDRSGEHDTLR